MSIEEIARRKIHHAANGRFFNPWYRNTRRSFFDVLKWLFFSRNDFREQKKHDVKFNLIRPDISKLDKTARNYMIWLGHSTILMKIKSDIVITDPVFWDLNFFLKRKLHSQSSRKNYRQ